MTDPTSLTICATSLHVEGGFVALARGERVTTGVGNRSWQPRAHFTGERGVYLFEHREHDQRAQLATRAAITRFEHGHLGAQTPHAFCGREISSDRARAPTPRARPARAASWRDSTTERAPFTCWPFTARTSATAPISSTGASTRSRPRSSPACRSSSAATSTAGAHCCACFCRAGKTLARGRTWPTPHPHSQIDHILGRGPWVSLDSFTRDGGSDHRALVADVELALGQFHPGTLGELVEQGE